MTFRSFLYKWARAIGDYNAVTRGRTGRRIGRRMTGRYMSRLMRALFR